MAKRGEKKQGTAKRGRSFQRMFDPKKALGDKAIKAAKKKALADIKLWSNLLVPVHLQQGLIMDVKEVACGDPKCSPIDTVFTLLWPGEGRGMFSIPYSPEEIQTQDELAENFPDVETVTLWSEGKRAPWPRRPSLRFNIGDRVECRVGPHPLKGWAPGRIIKLHYSESSWPPNMTAPYQIFLHDGRLIFAPQDIDTLIRLRPSPAPDAPSSPEYVPRDENDVNDNEDQGDDDEYGEDDMEEGMEYLDCDGYEEEAMNEESNESR